MKGKMPPTKMPPTKMPAKHDMPDGEMMPGKKHMMPMPAPKKGKK